MAVRRTIFTKGSGRDRSSELIITDYAAFTGKVKRSANRIMKHVAQVSLDAMRNRAPRDTGALIESGRAFTRKNEKGVSAVVTFGGRDAPVTPTKNAPEGWVDYAVFVNFNLGHSNEDSFFMERGFQDTKMEVDAYIVNEFRKLKP